MRVDKLMNKLCLVKTRTIAKKACDKKLVKINDTIAKSSSNLQAGDILEYEIYGYRNRLKISKIPTGNVSKNNSVEFYEILEREQLEISDQ
ncbi:MAG: S4 domain-containing protein [Candidatus Cloacimonadales bacterium]